MDPYEVVRHAVMALQKHGWRRTPRTMTLDEAIREQCYNDGDWEEEAYREALALVSQRLEQMGHGWSYDLDEFNRSLFSREAAVAFLESVMEMEEYEQDEVDQQ